MNSQKILKALQVVGPARKRVNLNLDAASYDRLAKLFPRHGKPSVSDVISQLVIEFLEGLKK